MRQPIAFAALLGAVLISTGAIAACPVQPANPKANAKPHKPPSGCVNLDGLPQISASVVAVEPLPARKAPTPYNLDNKPYNGPTLGLTKPDPGVKPTPTVGYRWSLD
jgi:hypothetical protein